MSFGDTTLQAQAILDLLHETAEKLVSEIIPACSREVWDQIAGDLESGKRLAVTMVWARNGRSCKVVAIDATGNELVRWETQDPEWARLPVN